MGKSNRTISRHRDTRSVDEQNTARLMLARLRSGADLRKGKVRRVKAAVRQQVYLNALKIEIAMERLCDQLRS